MLKAERASLEAIQVLLFLLLAFVVLLAAVWVGLLLARRVTRPIGALAASARRVGAGDFDALVEVEGGDEIGALSRAFNAMTSELRRRRAELVAANAELEATNRQLDEQRRRFGSILERLDAGVVAFWEDGRLAFLNDTARRLLDREGEGAVERLDDLLAPAPLAPLREFLTRAREAGPREETLKIGRRVLEAHLAQAPADSGGAGPSIVTLEDTTALVAAERAAAWEEAARRMAHEIKNPLTPIRLAAERMRRRAASSADSGDGLPRVVEEGASTIVQEVTALSALVDTFQRFARLPAAVLAPTDLAAVVAPGREALRRRQARDRRDGRGAGRARARAGRRGAAPPRAHQPRRQRGRRDAGGRARPGGRARRGGPRRRLRGGRRPRDRRRGPRARLRRRTTRRRAAARASGSRSSRGSRPSTAARCAWRRMLPTDADSSSSGPRREARMSAARVLVCDDEPGIRETLGQILGDEGYAVDDGRPRAGRGPARARRRAARRRPPRRLAAGRGRPRGPRPAPRGRLRRPRRHDLRPRHGRDGRRGRQARARTTSSRSPSRSSASS